MKTLEQWLIEYEASHRHPTNVLIHKICVPLIFLAVTALIYALPLPVFLAERGFNWAYLFLLLVFIRYVRLSRSLGLLMGVIFILELLFLQQMQLWLGRNHLALLFLVVFVFSWIMQFIGHKVEGKKPSFFKDLQFLLIGPLWTLYKTLGLPRAFGK